MEDALHEPANKPVIIPILKTKPIHKLQSTTKEYKNGDMEICICVFINYELKSTLLSYGTRY